MNQSATDTHDGVLQALHDFYSNYIVTTTHGAFQVFQSFTYGEMVISLLLFSIFILMLLHWVYEVLR